ncbi:NACHT domain-containing protein [Mastigocoleus sp. MO_188.B34]|uniref:NACHT domain-containing protein n=1 Tax=Mastigocoleus sp. MO_188.B34 TaxID=3036635 RepID=UPI002604DA52|nr:NACHT domain-containing protein [Mastigocoleus sp. MO_188.B34]MDJ0696484.1 NACHT domain-containing protein [Mastigocoleus sp. MO_188.B34]
MNQLPPDKSDPQQPADDSSQKQQADTSRPDNVVQGNQNRVVQGDKNTVIQGNNNFLNSTLNFIFNSARQISGESQILVKRDKVQEKLLKIVNTEVENRINSSLHNHVYIVLDKEQNPSQVESPWEMEVKVGFQPKFTLQNTEIITVFDLTDIAGRLLILGEPGSGKTTMLLKLASDLIKRANENPSHPIPVLFSLSAWKKDNQNIKDWLVEQLKEKYGVRKDIGKQWVENQEIIPLLDGLDELAAERQEGCIIKINEFLKPGTWSNPLVVCSRTEEYQHHATLLQLNNSLELSPFTPQQVYEYLPNTDNLQFWDSINNDVDLNQLAQTPLLLNIIVLSAQEISIETWQ